MVQLSPDLSAGRVTRVREKSIFLVSIEQGYALKVLLLNKHVSDTVGGSEIQCDLIARGLASRGHTVHYGAFDNRSALAADYPVSPLKSRKPGELAALLLQVRPDIVYWRYNLRQFESNAREVKRYGATFVFSVSHVRDVTRFPASERQKGFKAAFRHYMNFRGYRFVDALVTLSRDLLSRAPVRRQTLIPNMMETDTVPFTWPRPYIAWVANLKQRKRPEAFVDLAARLLQEGYGVDCLMVGYLQNKRYAYLEDTVTTPKNFHYLGPRTVAEVNGILAQSQFLVHTCEPEGFGNVFIQAWLQGRPTLTLGYDPDGLIASKALGSVGGTPAGLLRAARSYLEDQGLREAAGQRARRYAEANHTPSASIDRFEALFTSLLQERSQYSAGFTPPGRS